MVRVLALACSMILRTVMKELVKHKVETVSVLGDPHGPVAMVAYSPTEPAIFLYRDLPFKLCSSPE